MNASRRITRLEFKGTSYRTLYYLESHGYPYSFRDDHLVIEVPASIDIASLLILIEALCAGGSITEVFQDGHTERLAVDSNGSVSGISREVL